MQLRVVQSTPKLILEWDPVPGAVAGYRGRAGGVEKWTQTQQTRMTFAANATGIVIQALGVEDEGKYPEPEPEPEPEPTSTANIGWFSWGSPMLPPSHIGDYDLISTGPSSYAAGSSAAKKVFIYKSCISVNEGGDAYGVSAAQARSINAILKSTSGAEMINASYPTNKLADPGLDAYQDLWCQQVWGDMQGTGVDGLFIDDTLRTYVALSGGTISQKYPKPAPPALSTWETAMRSWANAIHTFFSSRGIEVVYNCNGYTPGYYPSNTGQSDREFWDILMPYADGFCTEYLHHNPTYPQADKLNRSTSYNQGWGYLWEEWQKLPAQAEVLGVQHWSLARGPSLAVDYNLCSQLLETKRGVAMWIPNGSPGEAWHATYDRARTLGAATGAKFKSGDEWRRDFAGGQVRVNPVAGTAGIS